MFAASKIYAPARYILRRHLYFTIYTYKLEHFFAYNVYSNSSNECGVRTKVKKAVTRTDSSTNPNRGRTAQHENYPGNIRQGEIAAGFGNASKISMSMERDGEDVLDHECPVRFSSASEGESRGVVGRLWLGLQELSRLPRRDVADESEKLSTENLRPCSVTYGQ
ncbi:hypothetical protein SCHPADRAFT_442813 [Schizopora paradoxa]|uniref:Uncharacterized protein n=1 Tax=Schizopora paradoxa TaxID=27342 RepID=A0A0H2RK78_9AGAM|nr:hypothetical protein SCHPADRAFT_442813 [Schizopora paradoxa]